MTHLLVSSMHNMGLYMKSRHLIWPNQMVLRNEKNQTLKEMMNAMLLNSGSPHRGEAILSRNYLLNKLPQKKEEKTPYKL